MHCLHKILVYIPDAIDSSMKTSNRNDMLEKIRSYAEQQTEKYCMQAFDWRECNSAGEWDSQYPTNVILAEDDIEYFIGELTEVIEMKNAEIENCFCCLKNSVGTDLESIVHDLQSKRDSMASYYLYCLAAHLYGEYMFDSYLFNTREKNSIVYPDTIEEIQKNPQNWALVMFDYHD